MRARANATSAATRREVEQSIARFEKRLDDANDALQTLGKHLGRGAQSSYKEVTTALRALRRDASKTNKQALKDFDKLREALTQVKASASRSTAGKSRSSSGGAARSTSRSTASRSSGSRSTAARSSGTRSTASRSTSSRSAAKRSTGSTAKRSTGSAAKRSTGSRAKKS